MWPEVDLETLAANWPGAITIGPFGSSLTASAYTPTGMKLVRGQDIGPGRQLEFKDPVFVGPETVSRLPRAVVTAGDLVFPHRGAIGRVGIVGAEDVMLSTSMMKITLDRGRCVPEFFLYFFRGPGRDRILEHASVVGTPGIAQPLSALRSLRVPVPPLHAQEAIAEVLGALDDKIAANRALADACEDLAVALAAEAPQKAALVEIASLSRKVVSPNAGSRELINHYSLPAFDSGALPSVEQESSIKSAKFLLDAACVLVSKLNPRIPRLWAVDEPTGSTGWASTEFMPLIPFAVSHRLLWSVLAQPDFGRGLAERVAGTSGSHQRVTPSDILEATIRDPRSLPLGVREQIESLVELASRQRRESRTLAELRDTLLPQLMSGRLRVRDAERAIEDVL